MVERAHLPTIHPQPIFETGEIGRTARAALARYHGDDYERTACLCGMLLELGRRPPSYVPDGKGHEQNEKCPFQISAPDHFLDAVTRCSNPLSDPLKESDVVADRFRLGR